MDVFQRSYKFVSCITDVNKREVVIANRWARQNVMPETFSMVLIMIRSSRALLFLVLLSIKLIKSYLLKISLRFKLILSFRVYIQRIYTILDAFAEKN